MSWQMDQGWIFAKSRGVVTVFRPVDMATNPTHHQYSQCDVVDRRYSFKRVRQYRRRLEQTSVQTKMAWSIPALMAGLEESCPKFKAELDWHHSRSNYYVYIYIIKPRNTNLYRCYHILLYFLHFTSFYNRIRYIYIDIDTHTQDATSNGQGAQESQYQGHGGNLHSILGAWTGATGNGAVHSYYVNISCI